MINSRKPIKEEYYEWEDTDKAASVFSDALRKEIDTEILYQVFESKYLSDGWYKVIANHEYEVSEEWMKSNISGVYRNFYNTWYFENEEDSILFKLTWQ